MDGAGKVLLYRGRGGIDKLIEWQTRSIYSHAALLYPNGLTVIESEQGYGVRRRVFDDSEWADRFAVDGMTAAQWDAAFKFAENEIGCGYDYRSVARFLTRRTAGSPTRWFCSELVFAALRVAGVKLLNRIYDWEVAPGHLALSTRLTLAAAF